MDQIALFLRKIKACKRLMFGQKERLRTDCELRAGEKSESAYATEQ